MVSSEQFRPHGGEEDRDDGPEGNPGGLPFNHADAVELMRSMGIIPDGVPDRAIQVHVVQPTSGEHVVLKSEPDREWHLDDIFPHTSLDDPPGFATPEEYKRLILGVLSEAADLEEFAINIAAGLGPDLVVSHGVPEDLAMQVCMDFARKIYREYRENA